MSFNPRSKGWIKNLAKGRQGRSFQAIDIMCEIVLRQKRRDSWSPMHWTEKMVREEAGEGKEQDHAGPRTWFHCCVQRTECGHSSRALTSFQKPVTQNLYHSAALSPYCTAGFLSFRKLKNTFINQVSDSRVSVYCPFYSEFNWHLVEKQVDSCKS